VHYRVLKALVSREFYPRDNISKIVKYAKVIASQRLLLAVVTDSSRTPLAQAASAKKSSRQSARRTKLTYGSALADDALLLSLLLPCSIQIYSCITFE
jgi:hypothetical protein